MASFEKRSINAETALVALQAAVAKARQLGQAMSVCIADENGVAKASIMMDIAFVLCSAGLGYLSWITWKEHA